MKYVLTQSARADIGGRPGSFYTDVSNEPRDIELVGLAGFDRSALLESEEIIEPLDVECAGDCIIEGRITHSSPCVASRARSQQRSGRSRLPQSQPLSQSAPCTSGASPSCHPLGTPET